MQWASSTTKALSKPRLCVFVSREKKKKKKKEEAEIRMRMGGNGSERERVLLEDDKPAGKVLLGHELRSHIKETAPWRLSFEVRNNFLPLQLRYGRVQRVCLNSKGPKVANLVSNEGKEGRHNQGDSCKHNGWELIAQRLTRTLSQRLGKIKNNVRLID